MSLFSCQPKTTENLSSLHFKTPETAEEPFNFWTPLIGRKLPTQPCFVTDVSAMQLPSSLTFAHTFSFDSTVDSAFQKQVVIHRRNRHEMYSKRTCCWASW